LALRRAHPALAVGAFRLLDAADGVLAYERRRGDAVLRVALNLTDTPKPLPFAGAILLSTLDGVPGDTLRADEGIICQ
jgi:oligo-1,6-glucosidase/alpha-glucosidase